VEREFISSLNTKIRQETGENVLSNGVDKDEIVTEICVLNIDQAYQKSRESVRFMLIFPNIQSC
jgi:hypothetical protein